MTISERFIHRYEPIECAMFVTGLSAVFVVTVSICSFLIDRRCSAVAPQNWASCTHVSDQRSISPSDLSYEYDQRVRTRHADTIDIGLATIHSFDIDHSLCESNGIRHDLFDDQW
jgi:hypothetical protein